MSARDKLKIVIPVVLVVLFFSIVTLYMEKSFDKSALQQNLMWVTPVFLGVTLVLVLVSLFWSFRHIKPLFRNMNKKFWIILLVVFLAGTGLRVFAAPHTHRLYYDEDIYMNIGQNIAREGRAILCNYGNQEECFEGIYNKQPNGYSFLLSPLFLFWTGEPMAHYYTAAITSLSILLVFGIAYLLFESRKAGIFSALFFSLIPIAILWAPTTSAGSVSIMFMSLAFFSFLAYFKTGKTPVLLLSFSSLAYAVQVRPEGLLFIPVVFLAFLLLDKNLMGNLRKREFLVIFIVFSALLVPHMLHTLSVRSEGWGASGNKLGTEYIENNLGVNGMFFFDNERFPVVFSALSILGLYPFVKEWRKKSILVVWFLSFFVLYLLFYAGSFDYGVDVRFSLNLYLPLAILGGCGCLVLCRTFNRFLKKPFPLALVSLLLATAFLAFYPFVSEVGEKAWDARIPHDFVVEKMEGLDDECWIFTHVPSLILVNGKNSLQAWYAQNTNVREKILQNDCVLFYEEYWCNAEPYKSGPCKFFHDKFDMEVYARRTERGKSYTLYKIKGEKS